MGFAKVGRVAGVGPTMARTVSLQGRYADGTRPPVAFIHANNFFADEPRTRVFASVVFDAMSRMTPIRSEGGRVPVHDDQSLHWLFSGYEIPP
jgi:hypothetical protein